MQEDTMGKEEGMKITWNTEDLPISQIERILGADHVGWILAKPRKEAIAYAHCRAMGWWHANRCEYYAAYRSLIAAIERIPA
jgi:hypothetical protein